MWLNCIHSHHVIFSVQKKKNKEKEIARPVGALKKKQKTKKTHTPHWELLWSEHWQQSVARDTKNNNFVLRDGGCWECKYGKDDHRRGLRTWRWVMNMQSVSVPGWTGVCSLTADWSTNQLKKKTLFLINLKSDAPYSTPLHTCYRCTVWLLSFVMRQEMKSEGENNSSIAPCSSRHNGTFEL